MAKYRYRLRWWQLWCWNTTWGEWYFRYKWIESIYEWAAKAWNNRKG